MVIRLTEYADLCLSDFFSPAASKIVIPGKKKPSVSPAFTNDLRVIYILTSLEMVIVHYDAKSCCA